MPDTGVSARPAEASFILEHDTWGPITPGVAPFCRLVYGSLKLKATPRGVTCSESLLRALTLGCQTCEQLRLELMPDDCYKEHTWKPCLGKRWWRHLKATSGNTQASFRNPGLERL